MRWLVAAAMLAMVAAGCSSDEPADDLIFQLAPVTEVVELAAEEVVPVAPTTGVLGEELLIYTFSADQAIRYVGSQLEGVVRFQRDPVFLRDYEVLTRDADQVVLLLRPVPGAQARDTTFEGLVVALGPGGEAGAAGQFSGCVCQPGGWPG